MEVAKTFFQDVVKTSSRRRFLCVGWAYTIEEADECIFLHGKNVAESNSQILVKTGGSDVVIAI